MIDRVEQLDEIVPKIHKLLGGRRLIALTGDLGAGKTSFSQAFCHYLGVREPVTSPTFSLINEYDYQDEKGKHQLLYHLDLYRLKNVEEALDLGIEEYLESGNYCLIEWPEIIEDLLPEEVLRINLQILPDSTRKMLIL